MTPAIELKDVTKIYRRYGGRHFATLKSALLQRSILRDLSPKETFPALQNVSFSVAPGRTYGVIGRNGSGKSTALKLVAGITKPTLGTVKVHGRISALISGRWFSRDPGRQRLHQRHHVGLSAVHGASRIVEFAEPRISSSAGEDACPMYAPGFRRDSYHYDVLLVDEVLVSDEGSHKC